MPAVSDSPLVPRAQGQAMVRLGTAGLPAWLKVPGPDLSDDGLPDPLRRIGNHIMWVLLRGIPLTHQDWTATHGGQCPRGCRPLPEGAPVATGPTHRWYTPETDPAVRQAIREAIARAEGAPLDVPMEREVLLPLRADGWNGYSCVVPEEPLPVMPTQPIPGDIY